MGTFISQYEYYVLTAAVAQWLYDTGLAFEWQVPLPIVRMRADFIAITKSGEFVVIETKIDGSRQKIQQGLAQLEMFARGYGLPSRQVLLIPEDTLEERAKPYLEFADASLQYIPEFYQSLAEARVLVHPRDYKKRNPATTTQVKHPDFYPFVPIIGRRSK